MKIILVKWLKISSMQVMKHKSVLLEEVINYLNVKQGGIYVDATVGYAGHSSVILRKIGKEGVLFAFDQDDEAIEYSNERLSKIGNNFTIFKSNFVNMKKYINENVDGILFDLGVSSPQLDEAYRGFSYHNDARLDMRMDRNNKLSAYEVVNDYDEDDLARIIYNYGEEKYAKSIARNIVKYRKNKDIETTLELVDIIKSSMPYKAMRDTHPAKRTFQAIRIEVNDELNVLKSALEQALDLLKVNGRICVITFHSLEDRIVANTFKRYSEVDSNVANLPYIPEEYLPKFKVVGKFTPSKEEISENNRARSAKLRVIERIR